MKYGPRCDVSLTTVSGSNKINCFCYHCAPAFLFRHLAYLPIVRAILLRAVTLFVSFLTCKAPDHITSKAIAQIHTVGFKAVCIPFKYPPYDEMKFLNTISRGIKPSNGQEQDK